MRTYPYNCYWTKKLNYDVVHVRQISKGCPDNEIIKLAKKENIIITFDKDFGELFSKTLP